MGFEPYACIQRRLNKAILKGLGIYLIADGVLSIVARQEGNPQSNSSEISEPFLGFLLVVFARARGMPQVTLYLTNEEQRRIEEFKEAHNMNRHATIKRAIRKMLGLRIAEFHHRLPDGKLVDS